MPILKYLMIIYCGIVVYPQVRELFEDKSMAFFWWVFGVLVLLGIVFALEWFTEFWVSWPFEE